MKSITIEGQERKEIGKRLTKAIRYEGGIPCVIYGGEKNVAFSAPKRSFKKLVYTPEIYVVNLNIDGKEYKAIMKDIQFHPVTENILHVDFQELRDDRVITTEIPVQLKGMAEGVKEGGRQIQKLRKLKVKLLPKDLREHIEIDVSDVVLGQSVKVGDLNIPGYEFLNSLGAPIVTVEVQRAMKEDRIADSEGELLDAEEAELAEGEEAAAGEGGDGDGGGDAPADGGGE
jgi:large subunit ribosomal protein L25